MKRLLPILALLVLMLPIGGRADVPVNPNSFSTTLASGTLGPFPCVGASNATWTWTSGGGATITIKGSADAIAAGTYNTNTNFGVAGVVTAPGSGSTSSGNTANYPQGIEATFTGNGGTLSGFVTCSGGLGSVAQNNVPSPLPSESPVPFPAFAQLHIGSGTALYIDSWPDTQAVTANITTAVTTQIIAGVAAQNTYVFFAAFQSSGTNSAVTAQLEYGTGALCATGTHLFGVSPTLGGAPALGTQVELVASTAGTSASAPVPNGFYPVAVPWIVPVGNSICGVTAGTTIAGAFVILYAQHAN